MDYVEQKAREAARALVHGDGSLRERIWKARWALHALTSEPFGGPLRDQFEEIMPRIDKGETPDNEALAHMTNDDVHQTASSILVFFENSLRRMPGF